MYRQITQLKILRIRYLPWLPTLARQRSTWRVLALLCFMGLGLSAGEWQSPSLAGTIPTGRIRIFKETKPAGSAVQFPFEASGNSLSRTFTLADGERRRLANLEPGSGYRIQEFPTDGWGIESATCDNGSSVNNISVGADETVTCTFVNVLLGKIVIKKATEPITDLDTVFRFTSNVADGGELAPSAFTLRNGEEFELTGIMPGNGYSVAEDSLPGWVLSTATCSDGSSITNIDVQPGETVTCTFVNRQNGTLIVRKITEPSPDRTNTDFTFKTDGTLSLNTFSLKNGDSQQFDNLEARAGYRVREVAIEDWQLTGQTCSNGSPTSNIRIDPGATVTCTFRNAGTLVDLRLLKEDGGITAEPGDTIVYTLRYENRGTQTAAGVFLTEQVPANTTFVGPSGPEGWDCAVGASAGSSCRYDVGNLSGDAEGQITFRVKVADTVPANVTTINNVAKIGYVEQAEVMQSATTTELKSAIGLSLTKSDDGATAEPGGSVLYTLNYENLGNRVAANVQITETVPANTTFAGPANAWSCSLGAGPGTTCVHAISQLNAGQAGSVTFVVKVNDALPANTTLIENVARIGGPQLVQDTGTENTELSAAPDLTISLDDDDTTVAPGGVVRYQVSYLNVGNQGATNVVITKDIPTYTTFHAAASSSGWVCTTERCTYTVGRLASGAGGDITFALKLARPLPAGVATIVNSAQIADDGMNGADATPANNSTQETTPIEDPATLVATKRATLAIDANQDGEFSPGDTIEYVVTLQNQRGIGVRNVQFSDSLDASLSLLSGTTTSQGTVGVGSAPGDPQIQVNVGTMAGDSTVVIRFRTGIRQPLPASVESVSNQGIVESRELALIRTDDPDTPTLGDPTETPINAKAQLVMSLADFLFVDSNNDTLVSVGDTLIYQLKIRNRGNGGSSPLQLQIPIAENAVLIENGVSTTAGVVREGNSPEDEMIRIDINEIAGGAEVNISFQVYIIAKTGFTAIQHQAAAYSQGVGGSAAVVSDDPDTNGENDATVSQLDQEIVTTRYLYLPIVAR